MQKLINNVNNTIKIVISIILDFNFSMFSILPFIAYYCHVVLIIMLQNVVCSGNFMLHKTSKNNYVHAIYKIYYISVVWLYLLYHGNYLETIFILTHNLQQRWCIYLIVISEPWLRLQKIPWVSVSSAPGHYIQRQLSSGKYLPMKMFF